MDSQRHQTTGWIGLLKLSFAAWNDHKALRLGAALAYYSVFSIGPLLVITLGIAGLVLGGDAMSGRLIAEIAGYVGAPAAAAVQTMVESASRPGSGWLATGIGFVVLMIGAAGVFSELKDALNTIWGVKPAPGFGLWSLLGEKFVNFGMVLAIGFLLLTSLVLSTLVAALGTRFSQVLALPPFVWAWVTSACSFGMVTVLFALIFKILPDVHIRWRDVWAGAAMTALLFETGKTGLGWYLARESTAGAYGAATSVVLLLLWVYYASCIMFFGAEFTRVHAQAHGLPVRPEAQAEKMCGEDRAKQGMEPQPGDGGGQMPGLLERERAEISAEAARLRASLSPGHLAETALRRHPGAVVAGGIALGIGLALLLFPRRRAVPVLAKEEKKERPPAAARGRLGTLVEFALPALLNKLVVPLVMNGLARRALPANETARRPMAGAAGRQGPASPFKAGAPARAPEE